MYYYGARYYDPRISIFVSVDPLAEKTMTPYQYVNNNPINLIDPTGMSAEGSGNGGGILSRVWSGIKSTFSSSNESSPIEDTLLDEMVINTTSKRGDKVFNLKISGRDRSVYENDKGIISGGYRLAKQFRNWSDKMLSGGFHFEDDDNKPKGDQSLRKKSFGSRPQAANAAGFVQAASFSKSMDGTQFKIGSNSDETLKITNSILTGFNLGQSIPDSKVQIPQTNFTYEVFFSGHALLKYTITSFNKKISNDTVIPAANIPQTINLINKRNEKRQQ